MRILIRKIREDRNLTLRKLALQSGVSFAQLYRIETGESDPTITTVCRIAAALHVKPWDLFDCDESQWDDD